MAFSSFLYYILQLIIVYDLYNYKSSNYNKLHSITDNLNKIHNNLIMENRRDINFILDKINNNYFINITK